MIKGISTKICILCVCVEINKRSFEPFCVWFSREILCCLTSTEARRPIRDGNELGGGGEGQKSETSKQAPTRKTKAVVDRRQNNRMLRQCHSGIAHAGTTAPRNCCPDCCAEQSHNVSSSAVGKQLKEKEVQLSSPAPPPCS